MSNKQDLPSSKPEDLWTGRTLNTHAAHFDANGNLLPSPKLTKPETDTADKQNTQNQLKEES